MRRIAVLTATYNHPQKLKMLYRSLTEQTDQDFSWIIVNDGSGEETKKVIDNFQRDNIIDLEVIHQPNSGKSHAINHGIGLAKDAEFFIIVDDDERLYSDAITIIKHYITEYRNSECGVIHFNRKNENGEIIAAPSVSNDFYMSYQEFKSKSYFADGYLGYFTDKLGNNRFTIFPGEKYIAPSTLFMKVTENCSLLWASAALGETEYLEGGITKQGRRLRLRNPRGMVEYCNFLQCNKASLKLRLLYSIQGYAYMQFADRRNLGEAERIGNHLIKSMRPFGKLLAIYWRKKYPSI